ncbi:MAG: hypothetical protein B6I37_00335 [Desulfobacteraceae bacterium 4572_35.2]|nr:MAG: hypothetical protein B6I37_00335 [Desulfobacteraceae bacterium 4572_35.2]
MNLRPYAWLFILLGFLSSIFIFYPVHDFLSYYEFSNGSTTKFVEFDSATHYVIHKFFKTLYGGRLQGTLFFGAIGVIVGAFFYVVLHRYFINKSSIEALRNMVRDDLTALISHGENDRVEFKSSFRWDHKQNGVNKALEHSVLKTIAAFMNSEGGCLLIGINDDGEAVGLEKDFTTLKTKNRDGFEVAIMTAIASKLGTPQCSKVTILFHTINTMEICHILVIKASKAVFVEERKDTKFFLRTGGGTKELNIKEASEYIADHWS